MYKIASKNAQTAKDRGRLADWVTGQQRLTDEERRQSLVDHAKWLKAQCAAATDKALKRELGQQIHLVETEINGIRPKRKNPGIAHYFIEAVKESVSKFEYDRLMRRAAEMQKAAEEAND